MSDWHPVYETSTHVVSVDLDEFRKVIKMKREELLKKAQELYDSADRMDASVTGPSWVSPERMIHYMTMANEKRQEASRLEAKAARMKQ